MLKVALLASRSTAESQLRHQGEPLTREELHNMGEGLCVKRCLTANPQMNCENAQDSLRLV